MPSQKWDNCTTTSLVDHATAEHGAPCLQGCGPILNKYDALGANGSYLGASTGPERSVGDGRGRYAPTSAAGSTGPSGAHRSTDGPGGLAGGRWAARPARLPTRDRAESKDNRGRVQRFEKGMVCDGPATGPLG